MSKAKKSPDVEKLDAGKVVSVSVVDENEIPAGADVKEGVELTGDDAEIKRVMEDAEAAAEAEYTPPTFESILSRIKEAQAKEV